MDTITIGGTIFGGRADGSGGYVSGESGLWDLSFIYDSSAMVVSGDDDLGVQYEIEL